MPDVIKQIMVFNAAIFTKLTFTRWNCVDTYCAEFHENSTNGLVAATRSRTDGLKRCRRKAFNCVHNSKKLLNLGYNFQAPIPTARHLCPPNQNLDALNETLTFTLTSTIPIRLLHNMLSHR